MFFLKVREHWTLVIQQNLFYIKIVLEKLNEKFHWNFHFFDMNLATNF